MEAVVRGAAARGSLASFVPSGVALRQQKGLFPHRHYYARSPRARLQVEVVTLCKRSGKDLVFEPQISELAKRMSGSFTVTSRWVKAEQSMRTVKDLLDQRSRKVYLLDEGGKLPRDSRAFASWLYKGLEDSGGRVSFVIGDADGLSEEVRKTCGEKGVEVLSLSTLTFTHKMVRLFLYEQLYRATEIRANSRYHR